MYRSSKQMSKRTNEHLFKYVIKTFVYVLIQVFDIDREEHEFLIKEEIGNKVISEYKPSIKLLLM